MWAFAPHYPFTSGVFCAFLRHSGTCSSYLLSLLQPGCGMHTAKGPTPAPWEGRPQTTSCTAWPVPQLQPEGGACTLSCRQSQGTRSRTRTHRHTCSSSEPATLHLREQPCVTLGAWQMQVCASGANPCLRQKGSQGSDSTTDSTPCPPPSSSGHAVR